MSTRLYLPSTTAADGAAGTPAVHANWDSSGVNFVRRLLARTTQGTADATQIEDTTTLFPELICYRQYISEPIIGQTLSPSGAWTLKGQIRGQESATSVNATPAISVRVISGDGTTVRGTMLAVTAADLADGDEELSAAALTNRKFRNASEVAAIPLSEVTAQSGDRIVVEIGTRNNTSNGGAQMDLSFGDDGGADLAEDDSTTTANNPWIEFSGDITFSGSSSAVLTGTAVGGISEADVVAGGKTIVITLTGDTWVN